MRKIGVVIIVLMGLLSISLAFIRLNTQYVTNSSLFDFFILNIPSTSLILVGSFLVIYRERLAARLFFDTSFNTRVDGVYLVRLGFIFLGLFLATLAFSAMLISIIRAVTDMGRDEAYYGVVSLGFWEEYFPVLAGEVFQFATGVIFIFGSMALSRRVWSLPRVEINEEWEDTSACPICHEPFDPADYRSDAIEPKCSRCSSVIDLGGQTAPQLPDDSGAFEYECGECGAIVVEKDKKCPKCGANIEEAEDVDEGEN